MARRLREFNCTAIVAAAFCLPPAAAGTQIHTARVPRVRYADLTIRQFLDDGARLSPTFQRVVDAIQASDGIVYVDVGSCGSVFVHGCLLHWIEVSGGVRFLRIRVTLRDRSCAEVIATIGHELQHAAEVLAEPGVTKVAAMRALFERIGVPSMKSARDFETLEAIRIGLAVEQEYVEAMSRQHQDAGSRRPRSKGSSLACN